MKRKPLSLESLRRLGVEAGSREAKAVIAAALELHRASERVKRPEFTDEMGEHIADSNPPLPGVLVVFAQNDSVEGQFDDESQSMMECTPEPNLVIPLNAFMPGSVQSAFTTLAAELGARIAAEILPANVLARTPDMITWWTRARREAMFFGGADQKGHELNGAIYPHPALVFKVTDRELFVRALEKDERPAGE